MINLKGKYNTAKVFTDNIEEKAQEQIVNLLNQDFIKNAKIRVMPDAHYGAGCVIGFTADLGNKVIPNLVGVDIGCGLLCANLGKVNIDFEKLDNIIHNEIPAGREVHKHNVTKLEKINNLICFRDIDGDDRFNRAIGTLGSGNHYCEINKDNEDNFYLTIHSGSRNMGKKVADFYQNLAIENCKGIGDLNERKLLLINKLKQEGNKHLIQSALRNLESEFQKAQPIYQKDLCFLEDKSRENYLHDMNICQEYAVLNRETMANIILKNLLNKTVLDFEYFQTIHNYIDFKDNIIRKGAVSAYHGERLIIPINMRDGSILATGKGNPDWNNSAPHGAGRLMGRNEAKRTLSMDEFTNTMKDVYTTTVGLSTLDEAPMAYKPMQEIVDNIQDTVTIDKIIKPVYNFKSAE
jgi:tRNA-splicing ligase RtcB (3'-phosphate/5'-hydroxy nucleic acid ligase)